MCCYMKYVRFCLVLCPIILVLLLILNINIYLKKEYNNKKIIESTNDYKNRINEVAIKQNNLNNELTSLKKENPNKVWDYERWTKWNKEILEKIN